MIHLPAHGNDRQAVKAKDTERLDRSTDPRFGIKAKGIDIANAGVAQKMVVLS